MVSQRNVEATRGDRPATEVPQKVALLQIISIRKRSVGVDAVIQTTSSGGFPAMDMGSRWR
jgi:hypothetical protein